VKLVSLEQLVDLKCSACGTSLFCSEEVLSERDFISQVKNTGFCDLKHVVRLIKRLEEKLLQHIKDGESNFKIEQERKCDSSSESDSWKSEFSIISKEEEVAVAETCKNDGSSVCSLCGADLL
jgi:hypothetical protein